MALDVDQAELIGAAAHSVAFGAYFIMFIATILRLIVRARLRDWKPNKILLGGSLSLFVLILTHFLVDQLRLAKVFFGAQGQSLQQQELDFLWQRDKRNVLRNILLLLEILVMDFLMVYRVYMIWEREWRSIVFPGAALLGTLVTGIIGCVRLVDKPWPNMLIMELKRSVIGPFSFSLATNLLAVALIGWRVVLREWKLRGTRTGSLSNLITITVEGAALYCVVNLIAVVLLVVQPIDYFAVVHVISPVTGISCCLLQLRVGPSGALGLLANSPVGSGPGSKMIARGSVHMRVHVTREEEVSVTEGSELDNVISEGGKLSPDPYDEQHCIV